MSPNRAIPYAKQTLSNTDIEAVVATLKSDWLTQGPKIGEFEERLAESCGAKYAVAVSHGTAALHLAMLAIGIKPGDRVITTTMSFVATSNSIIYAGGKPVFADIKPGTFNIDSDHIEKKLFARSGVKAILPVHFGGMPAEMESIHRIAKTHHLRVIEDACHALGGVWTDSNGEEHRIGDGAFSDMTVFSFHPVKQITTAEGGAIVTNHPELYEKLVLLRNHGITKDSKQLRKDEGGWYYEMQELGFNYRISDVQAALGLQQLQKNDAWVKRRLDLVKKYDSAFSGSRDLGHQIHPANDRISYHLYVVQTPWRKALYEYLRERGVFTQVHYIPIHLHPYYQRNYGYKPGDFPVAEAYYSKALSLPLYPSLSDEEQDYVIHSILEFHRERTIHRRSGLQS
ncbi:MAG: UDP-4-amino-4,6-dideoxy-N-acetyl-beta-L-altrosamine transaminase [bacterium]